MFLWELWMKIVTLATISLWLLVLAPGARSEGVLIVDPLEAFIQGKYERGDDYFMNGNQNTYIFRCTLTKEKNGLQGIALSEISIWGNRGGPWEVFRRAKTGGFAYVGTKSLTDTACLQSCRSKEYLETGRCNWQIGWPKQ
jgi:hypothetical protein